jgi:four helix bundle protein
MGLGDLGKMGRGALQLYQDLVVWQRGMELAAECYELTRQFPKTEMYGMVSQIRRSAASVPANIAEGYGRGSRRQYLQFLQIAQGSLYELETHLLLAKKVKLTSSESAASSLGKCVEVSKLLRGLIVALRDRV